MNRCIFCEKEIPPGEDNLCRECREEFGEDVSVSNYPGIVGSVDISIQDMKRQILPLVPGWRDAMGQPLKSVIKMPANPLIRAPAYDAEITIRFKEGSDRPVKEKA